MFKHIIIIINAINHKAHKDFHKEALRLSLCSFVFSSLSACGKNKELKNG
jgi:hypothetical protein